MSKLFINKDDNKLFLGVPNYESNGDNFSLFEISKTDQSVLSLDFKNNRDNYLTISPDPESYTSDRVSTVPTIVNNKDKYNAGKRKRKTKKSKKSKKTKKSRSRRHRKTRK